MSEMLIPITMFVSIAVVMWKLIDSRQKVRMMALEKGSIDENFNNLFATERGFFSKPNRHGALKWGLVALLIGLALLISIPLQSFYWAQIHDDELITGLIFTGGGLAFLIYYKIVSGEEKSAVK